MSEWFVNTISSLELVNVSKLFFIALQTGFIFVKAGVFNFCCHFSVFSRNAAINRKVNTYLRMDIAPVSSSTG